MERKRFYNNSLILENNIVTKNSQWPIDQDALSIISNTQLDFLPKIIDYTKYTIRYEYVDGPSVGTYLKEGKATAQEVVKIYTQINDIWKAFLKISKIHLDGAMIYHNDLHLWNMIYKDNKIVLTDLDSIIVSNHVSFQTTHSYLFHQMEELLYARIQK